MISDNLKKKIAEWTIRRLKQLSQENKYSPYDRFTSALFLDPSIHIRTDQVYSKNDPTLCSRCIWNNLSRSSIKGPIAT